MEKNDIVWQEFIYGINSIAEETAFNAIPQFWKLRRERIEAEEKYQSSKNLKLEQAKKLLDDMETKLGFLKRKKAIYQLIDGLNDENTVEIAERIKKILGDY